MKNDTIYIHEVPDEPKERGFWYLFWRMMLFFFIGTLMTLLAIYVYFGSIQPEDEVYKPHPTHRGSIGQDKSEWIPINQND